MEKDIREVIEDIERSGKKLSEDELDELVEKVLDEFDAGNLSREEAEDLLKRLSDMGSMYAEEMLEELMEEAGEEEIEESWFEGMEEEEE